MPHLPGHVQRADLAREQYGALGSAWLAGTTQGDPLADAVVADLATRGRRAGQDLVGRAVRDGIDTVPGAPDSLRALFAQLDEVPDWVDHDQLDRAGEH